MWARAQVLAVVLIGTPWAFMSLIVRVFSGYPTSGGAGVLPVLMATAHVSAMYVSIGLFVEAAAALNNLSHRIHRPLYSHPAPSKTWLSMPAHPR